MQPLGRWLLLFALLATGACATAGDPDILVIRSGDNQIYLQVQQALIRNLEANCPKSDTNCALPRVTSRTLDQVELELLAKQPDRWRLIVAIGVKVARALHRSQLGIPVLHTLIPQSASEELELDERTGGNYSAVFIDQPILRQLRLVPFIRPERHRLGVLIGPSIEEWATDIALAAQEIGIPLAIHRVQEEGQVGQAVRRVLRDSDVLLALPDPLVYNRRTIVNIMLSSYHSRVPVIGFSAAYVRSGAIAAVYSTPDDVGRHVGDLVRRFLAAPGGTLPPPQFPRYFHVEVNAQVAHSLGIEIPAAETIRRRLESLEGR